MIDGEALFGVLINRKHLSKDCLSSPPDAKLIGYSDFLPQQPQCLDVLTSSSKVAPRTYILLQGVYLSGNVNIFATQF